MCLWCNKRHITHRSFDVWEALSVWEERKEKSRKKSPRKHTHTTESASASAYIVLALDAWHLLLLLPTSKEAVGLKRQKYTKRTTRKKLCWREMKSSETTDWVDRMNGDEGCCVCVFVGSERHTHWVTRMWNVWIVIIIIMIVKKRRISSNQMPKKEEKIDETKDGGSLDWNMRDRKKRRRRRRRYSDCRPFRPFDYQKKQEQQLATGSSVCVILPILMMMRQPAVFEPLVPDDVPLIVTPDHNDTADSGSGYFRQLLRSSLIFSLPAVQLLTSYRLISHCEVIGVVVGVTGRTHEFIDSFGANNWTLNHFHKAIQILNDYRFRSFWCLPPDLFSLRTTTWDETMIRLLPVTLSSSYTPFRLWRSSDWPESLMSQVLLLIPSHNGLI